MVIAIDGPSGAGKSTVAKLLAEKLDIEYIDTGAMYRAAALYLLRLSTDIYNEESLALALSKISIDFRDGAAVLNGEDVSQLIRTPEITALASESSALAPLREKLVTLQRRMGEEKNVVLDGRDIGTNVFPNAEFKYYLTATPEVRARRRTDEMAARGEKPNYREVLCAINKRDENDMSRELNPLTQADDAILIVTDDMDAEEVANVIVKDVLAANVKY